MPDDLPDTTLEIRLEGGPLHMSDESHLQTQFADDKGRWVLVLSRYHRDNLLWLLNLCGYGYTTADHSEGGIPERARVPGGGASDFGIAQNGDWLGEIALMLAHDDGCCLISEVHGDTPNCSIEKAGEQLEASRRRIADYVNGAIAALASREFEAAEDLLASARQLLGVE